MKINYKYECLTSERFSYLLSVLIYLMGGGEGGYAAVVVLDEFVSVIR